MTADTSPKGFLMSLNEDIRKTLTDPTPLYFAAGVIDKIREETPGAVAAVRATDPKEVQAKVTDRAKDTQVRMNKALGELDADIKKLREQTQSLAMQGLGYAAEYAVKAREAYGELAERGRGAVQNWRGQEDAPEITVERQSVRVAEPPKQGRTATAKNGRSSAGTSGTASGTAKSSTARSTSAKSAAPKSATEKGATQKTTADRKSTAPTGSAGQKSAAAKKPAGGSTPPKSGS